jgi:xanthine dehydrogenase accessory factor
MPHRSADAALLGWLLDQRRQGYPAALLTITDVEGGSPRPVGAQMAVVDGQNFHGYLSGGCVEPAIAREIEPVIAARQSRMLRFGRGSPFLDIRFPCGGGIEVLAAVEIPLELLETAMSHIADRQPFALTFDPTTNGCTITDGVFPPGWTDGKFVRPYLPETRLVVAGRGPEFEAVVRLGSAMGYDMAIASPDAQSIHRMAPSVSFTQLLTHGQPMDFSADPWTATVLLFHEREWEDQVLSAALAGPQFYLGALGSQRTQAARRERLLTQGHSMHSVDRLRGPIGLIPQARDPATLALSVLSEIAVRRREADDFTRSAHA